VHYDRALVMEQAVGEKMRLARRAQEAGNCHEALRHATEAEHLMGRLECELKGNEDPGTTGYPLSQRVANLWGAIARQCVRR
jgi:hypothetical protein